MALPVPDNDQIIYGLSVMNEAFFKWSDEKYSYILDPEFSNYSDLHQYLLESSKRAIHLAFTHGFTCNGKNNIFKK